MANKLKVAALRNGLKAVTVLRWLGKTAKHIAVRKVSVERLNGDQIPLRIYQPPGDGPFPVILYFHGGGWVIGDLPTYDPMCRDLCDRSDCIVVAVDYRRAPEAPFPAAPEDCLTALSWLVEHIELYGGIRDAIVVAGDSAGGNLAAVTALQARDKFLGLIKGQLLIYPVTDHYHPGTESYTENAKGPVLSRALMTWFWDTYLHGSTALADGQTRHPLATPLVADNLTDLPPALVITAERDPLRDEGRAYAERLQEQGCAVQNSLYLGATHGFVGLQGPQRNHRAAMDEMSEWLQAIFARL
jgi:acetyl esterase